MICLGGGGWVWLPGGRDLSPHHNASWLNTRGHCGGVNLFFFIFHRGRGPHPQVGIGGGGAKTNVSLFWFLGCWQLIWGGGFNSWTSLVLKRCGGWRGGGLGVLWKLIGDHQKILCQYPRALVLNRGGWAQNPSQNKQFPHMVGAWTPPLCLSFFFGDLYEIFSI